MTVEERVPLSTPTTMKTGGAAAVVVTCESAGDVAAGLTLAKERSLPFFVLGEGSNVLPKGEGFPGVVLLMRIPGVSFIDQGEGVLVTAGAGVSWEALVSAAAARGLWGIENLAGIPGTVGAAPVQNIGAYGTELSSVVAFVDVMDEEGGALRFAKEECAFGYRESRFKREPLIITSVGFLLKKRAAPDLSYGDLAALAQTPSTPHEVGEAVRAIRARKFPDLSTTGTAGSFFKNPVVSRTVYESLRARLPGVPGYEHQNGVKVPLAYLLDAGLSLRGFSLGAASLYEKQPLVLTLAPGGSASDAEALASMVEQKVKEEFGIEIEREVRMLA